MSSRALLIELLSCDMASLMSDETSAVRRANTLKSSYLSNSRLLKSVRPGNLGSLASPMFGEAGGRVKACCSSKVRTDSCSRFL